MVSVQDEALDEVPLQEEDSTEFRVLMVYAQRTLPNSKFQDLMSQTPVKKREAETSNGEGHTNSLKKKGKKKKGAATSNGKGHKVDNGPLATPKKKKSRRHWGLFPKCLQPPRDKEDIKFRSDENPDDARFREIVQRLKSIVQGLEKQDHENSTFRGLKRLPSIQHDGDGEEDLIKDIVEILRAEGDKMNKEIVQEQRLQANWSYSFFQKLTEAYVSQMIPASEPEDIQQTSKIALCIHATTKLTALDSHPMNRMFGFGARYLKENYSQWIQQQGGWEKAMGIPDTQDESEEE
ncbi:apoptosis facilitator Bcl-2-like protein 14 [Bufo gargarizans]|uniref:apoptosis facilitator Bcl-2-like protein 14 n=1 Tax=Bufo gargarizans TaxID=30331 RepID=UPI001CF52EB6|nr:apoptosis facilitator Bcl-2-like protein 14 [Bufo gargarizans]